MAQGGAPGEARKSSLAGTWYPSSSRELRGLLGKLLESARPETAGRPRIIIVPHAGYAYSGPVAAWAYAAVRGTSYRRAVVLGQSHRALAEGIELCAEAGIETPLGTVKLDAEGAKPLRSAGPELPWKALGTPQEHSVEIQYPFLQMALPDTPALPVLLGGMDSSQAKELAEAMIRSGLLKDGLLVVSTDLSHYHPAAVARRLDAETARLIESGDADGFADALAAGRAEVCGPGAVLVGLEVAEALGASFQALALADSGEASGDERAVVGYLAAVACEVRHGDRGRPPRDAPPQRCPRCGAPMPDLRGGTLSVCQRCGYKDDCC